MAGTVQQKNLELAFRKARKHKTLKPYVIEFEKNLKDNLLALRYELLLHSYKPKPLKTFILRDPKTRVISKSDFRDRVVHHALCNIIEPIFDKSFIHDSYANRKGKGVLKALKRFDCFKKKVSKNNIRPCYVLKADIKHYFDAVDHETLISIIRQKIKNERIIRLIEVILANHKTKIPGKGMPLGNLTIQFFANVYLNELDQHLKHMLKIKHYVRYVDDFAILDSSRDKLEEYKRQINHFLKTIKLELHPDKSRTIALNNGIGFLGFRIFYYHKLLKKSNIKKIAKKLCWLKTEFDKKKAGYDKAFAVFEGWLNYFRTGNTRSLRKRFTCLFEVFFPGMIAGVEINRWLKLRLEA